MNVRFFGGRKSEYVSIPKHNPIGLYFCADTRELFLGDKLLSDGLRVVPTFADLPSISEHKAAEGVIYFVAATKNGYVLPRGGYDWLQVIYAPTSGEGADLSNYYTKAEVDEAILKAITNIEIEVDLSKYATKEEVAVIQQQSARNEVKILAIDSELFDIKEQIANIPTVDLTGYATKEEVVAVEAKIPSIEGLATKQELEEAINSIEHPVVDLTGYATTEAVEAIADGLAQTQGQLDRVTSGVENLQRAVGNLDATTVKQKYEILPLEGMFVQYNDNEIRVNTQHVDIATLPTQNAGDGSSDSYYYATFRAYAPEGATSVIEGSSDKMDTEHSELAIDSYGRKYTTIWPAIANKSGSTWSKFGDRSNVDKYLGFYYNFHWYAGDKLISKEKVRVILTNDACHNDLVPDAVARRIDDKVSTVTTTVNNLSEVVENIENTYVQNSTLENYVTNDYITQQNYVTNNYIVQNYTTTEQLEATYVTNEKVTEVVTNEVNTVVTEQIETKVTEVIQEKVDAGEIEVKVDSITYGDF